MPQVARIIFHDPSATGASRFRNNPGDAAENDYWHYIDVVCSDPVIFCSGEQMVDGMRYESEKRRITCPECRDRLKKYRKVSLK
jgi:hypothetical protein